MAFAANPPRISPRDCKQVSALIHAEMKLPHDAVDQHGDVACCVCGARMNAGGDSPAVAHGELFEKLLCLPASARGRSFQHVHEPVDGNDLAAVAQELTAGRPQLSRHAAHAERTASGSTVSGSRPMSPATTASGVPWPMPVAPSEP